MRETALQTLKALPQLFGTVICGIMALAGGAALAHPGSIQDHAGLVLAEHPLAWGDAVLTLLSVGALLLAAQSWRTRSQQTQSEKAQ